MDTAEYDSFARLFPMPMTSIEKFHWFDDNHELPNLIFCRLRFDGRLDREHAKQAWQFAIERQPFGDVEPQEIGGRWCWVSGPRGKDASNRSIDAWNGTRFEYSEHPCPPADWNFDQQRIPSSVGSYLGISVWPVTSQPGQKSSSQVVESPDNADEPAFVSEVWFSVHHAIGDGAAAVAVINDWMLVFANLSSGKPPGAGIHRLDPSLLARRNVLGLLNWSFLKHLHKQPIALFGATKFLFRKTVELIPQPNRGERAETESPSQFPAIVGQWISDSQVNKLVDEAKTNDVMLNSVLLGQLYLALARWRREQGFHSDRDWMRVILPMSIRNVSDRRLPAANRATIVQVDRCGREMADVGKFYRSLNREIKIIRGWQLDKTFLLVMRCLSAFEPLLIRAARSKKSRGMAVFTNLGEPFRKSERASSRARQSSEFIRPVEFDPFGPIRTGTPVNFTASRHGPRLRITLHYDAQLLSRQQGEQLLTIYLEQLNSVG